MLNKAINVLKKYTNIIVNSDLIIIFTGLVKCAFFMKEQYIFLMLCKKKLLKKRLFIQCI